MLFFVLMGCALIAIVYERLGGTEALAAALALALAFSLVEAD